LVPQRLGLPAAVAIVLVASKDRFWVAPASLTMMFIFAITPGGTCVIVHGSLSTKTLQESAAMK